MDQLSFEEFLRGYFQEQMDLGYELDNTPSPEERPFDNRYEARKIYQALLKHPHLLPSLEPTNEPQESIDAPDENHPLSTPFGQFSHLVQHDLKSAMLGVVQLFLADNYFDTEENAQAYDSYKASLDSFRRIFQKDVENKFLCYMFKAQTNLGFLEVSRDNTHVGLALFQDSEKLYQRILARLSEHPQNVTNFRFQFQGLAQKSKDGDAYIMAFAPLAEGGINLTILDPMYTQLLFYLAQSYAKLGDKPKAAEFSGLTMKRQLSSYLNSETKNFDFTDFANNCIGLARYYAGENLYAQALHVLSAGFHNIPKSFVAEHGSLYFMRGTTLRLLFEFNLNFLDAKPSQSEIKQKQHSIELITLNLDFNESIADQDPKAVIYNSYESAKEHFRKSLIDFRKAMQNLPLDGYVTDHGEIVKELVRLYGIAIKRESDPDRIEALRERQIEFIEPVLNQLNPKYYENLHIELHAELGEIRSQMFEDLHKAFSSGAKVSKKMNRIGLEAVNSWTIVIGYFAKIKEEHVQSYVNSLYNKARILSKLSGKDKMALRDNLAESLKCYEEVRDLLRSVKSKKKVLDESLEHQLKLTEEFCEMLPFKISKM